MNGQSFPFDEHPPSDVLESLIVSRSHRGHIQHTVSDPALIAKIIGHRKNDYRQVSPHPLTSAWRRPPPPDQDSLVSCFDLLPVGVTVPVIASAAAEAPARWRKLGITEINAQAEAACVSFDVVSQALFSSDPAVSGADTLMSLSSILEHRAADKDKGRRLWPSFRMRPQRVVSDLATTQIREQLTRMLAARLDDPGRPNDLVSNLLIAAAGKRAQTEATAATISMAERLLLNGQIVGGRTLTRILALLIHHPDIQVRASREAIAAAAQGPQDSFWRRTPYLRQIISEALRIYPLGKSIERVAIRNDALGGVEIRRGDRVVIWPAAIHRHRSLWANPDRFDPDNFTPERRDRLPPYQYLPFGIARSASIVEAYSVAQLATVLAVWLSQYRFAPAQADIHSGWQPPNGDRLMMRILPIS